MSDNQALTTVPLTKLPAIEQASIAQELLNGYLNGANMADLARQRGFSTASGYSLLIRFHEQAWKDAQIGKALETLEAAEAKMASATDHLELARSEKMVKAAQWKLERLLSRVYGQERQVTPGVVVIQIGASLRDEPKTIEATA